MKKLIASVAAAALIATPAIAAQTTKMASSKTMKAPARKSIPVAKQAKAESESTATEAKEHKAAARHHAKRHMKSHKKMAAKKMTTKKAATTTTTKS